MNVVFGKITDFPRGTLFQMLSDAYSFDARCAENWGTQWQEFDDFFFDNREIADRCGFITALDGKPIGFVSWDPRKLPESVEVGHNCILSQYKGRGFGTAQMREAVRRMTARCPAKIIVTTSGLMIPAQKMYERAGFQETGRRDSGNFSGDLIDYEMELPRVHSYAPGGLESPDYEKLRTFLQKLASPHYTFARWDWMITHSLLDRAWLGGIGLWDNADGKTVAAALYDCQPGETYLSALPNYQMLYPAMIAYAEKRLNPGTGFSLSIPEEDTELQAAALHAGYHKTNRMEQVSIFNISKNATEYSMPPGFRLTDMRETFDPVGFGEAISRGFEDTCLPELTDDLRTLLTLQVCRPHVEPELKIAAVSPAGKFVCCCGFWTDPASEFAVLEPLSTLPEFRCKGLARAVVLEGIRRVAARGAKYVLVGSTQEFYHHIGFRPYRTSCFWEK